ncbi:MAG: class I SAM-dependent methyltransferase [Parvularculaceae bacterium]|nr:class I SAM-dependent methyltransferase [Parvularculaceae bacterium]
MRRAPDGRVQTNTRIRSKILITSAICDQTIFRENVRFREIDMNAIPTDLNETFDFCWSACCLEHLGSIKHGLDFIVKSTRLLRRGGVAVHTTEFNLSSNDETIESRDLSLLRRRDIEAVVDRLEASGCHVEKIDWSQGHGFLDGYIDLPPYKQEPHLRLKIGDFDCTSIGLIITKRV